MPFRVKQTMQSSACGTILFPQIRHLENGSVEFVMVDQSECNLPASETTDLKNVLDAGIDLKQVNPKILGVRKVTIVADDAETDNSNNNDNKELNNG